MPLPPAHVVLLSPGAKVGLTKAFRDAAIRQRVRLSAWESDPWSPAARLCSTIGPGGPIETEAAAGTLLAWCIRQRIGLVVPSRHDDLPTLARTREYFVHAGVSVAVSSQECVEICLDKKRLWEWLRASGFPTPRQATAAKLSKSELAGTFPLIAKHPRGSGSRHLRRLHKKTDLGEVPDDWIVQEIAAGAEFTINAYVDLAGRCACEVPHERLLISEGEVLRGRTRKVPELTDLARRISEALPGARGPLNIQVFWDEASKRALVTDINPRFGGGYPLAHHAGARFTSWLIREYLLQRPPPRFDDWEDGLLMVRYREAAFYRGM